MKFVSYAPGPRALLNGASSATRSSVAPSGFTGGSASSVLRTCTLPQLLKSSASGGMKSFSAAVKLSELRDFKYALPNDTHWSEPPAKASKSICASPKVRADSAPSPSEFAAVMADALVQPGAPPAAVRLIRGG